MIQFLRSFFNFIKKTLRLGEGGEYQKLPTEQGEAMAAESEEKNTTTIQDRLRGIGKNIAKRFSPKPKREAAEEEVGKETLEKALAELSDEGVLEAQKRTPKERRKFNKERYDASFEVQKELISEARENHTKAKGNIRDAEGELRKARNAKVVYSENNLVKAYKSTAIFKANQNKLNALFEGRDAVQEEMQSQKELIEVIKERWFPFGFLAPLFNQNIQNAQKQIDVLKKEERDFDKRIKAANKEVDKAEAQAKKDMQNLSEKDKELIEGYGNDVNKILKSLGILQVDLADEEFRKAKGLVEAKAKENLELQEQIKNLGINKRGAKVELNQAQVELQKAKAEKDKFNEEQFKKENPVRGFFSFMPFVSPKEFPEAEANPAKEKFDQAQEKFSAAQAKFNALESDHRKAIESAIEVRAQLRQNNIALVKAEAKKNELGLDVVNNNSQTENQETQETPRMQNQNKAASRGQGRRDPGLDTQYVQRQADGRVRFTDRPDIEGLRAARLEKLGNQNQTHAQRVAKERAQEAQQVHR